MSGPFLGVATPGQPRTRTSSPQKPRIALLSFFGRSLTGAISAAGNLLETLDNLAETRLSPKASVSAAICCALLHSEPTISEIRAVFVACRTRVSVRTALRTFSLGFPRVITFPCSLHFLRLRYGQSVRDATSCTARTGVDARIELWQALVQRPPSA